MDAATINRWVRNLGCTYEQLVAEGVIPILPLRELYEGRDWLDMEPAPGVEMEFRADTKQLEKILFTLIPSQQGDPFYTGELPAPFVLKMNRKEVNSQLGTPIKSKGPGKLPGGLGMRGGWDTYHLAKNLHPSACIRFSYTSQMEVKTLAFVLLDPEHSQST